VSAPLFLVDVLPAAGPFTLDGPEGHHAATVQRLRAGETLILADGRGGSATAEVTAVGRGSVTVTVTGSHHEPAPDPRLVVVQGIAKGDRGELAVQAMTEIGVDEILPWAASRSVAQWRGERGGKSREKWAATAREAAKQARRAWLPMVGGDPDCSTKQVVARLGTAAAAFVLHEEATSRLAEAPLPAAGSLSAPGALPAAGDIVLVVGPEGGISDAERVAFEQAGATAVRLGREVLRTSTAGVAALAVLSARLGRW
jgi:16S rRNA (uracil1498-N3)-methyltransferase